MSKPLIKTAPPTPQQLSFPEITGPHLSPYQKQLLPRLHSISVTSSAQAQSGVSGHCFASGFVSPSQLVVLQVTEPGVPDKPAPTPHLVAHPLGSPCSQSPQSSVLGHTFAPGFASGSQLNVLQSTAPGVPDKPAPTPHLVAHPLGSPCTQSPSPMLLVLVLVVVLVVVLLVVVVCAFSQAIVLQLPASSSILMDPPFVHCCRGGFEQSLQSASSNHPSPLSSWHLLIAPVVG